MKTRVEFVKGNISEVNDIDRYHRNEVNIIFSGPKALHIFCTPVKQAPFIHIIFVFVLNFNIPHFGSVGKFRQNVQPPRFTADDFGGQVFGFQYFDGGKIPLPVRSRTAFRKAAELEKKQEGATLPDTSLFFRLIPLLPIPFLLFPPRPRVRSSSFFLFSLNSAPIFSDSDTSESRGGCDVINICGFGDWEAGDCRA
jgi:hypothetical protein